MHRTWLFWLCVLAGAVVLMSLLVFGVF